MTQGWLPHQALWEFPHAGILVPPRVGVLSFGAERSIPLSPHWEPHPQLGSCKRGLLMCCFSGLDIPTCCIVQLQDAQGPRVGFTGLLSFLGVLGSTQALHPAALPQGHAPQWEACPLLPARFGCAQQPPSLPSHTSRAWQHLVLGAGSVAASLSRGEDLGSGCLPSPGHCHSPWAAQRSRTSFPFFPSCCAPGMHSPSPESSGCFPWAAQGRGRGRAVLGAAAVLGKAVWVCRTGDLSPQSSHSALCPAWHWDSYSGSQASPHHSTSGREGNIFK